MNGDKKWQETEKLTGRVTIPTDLDVVPQTLELMKTWGEDAIRDCDGTSFPEALAEKRPAQKFMPPIIRRGKIMRGQRQIRMKYSSVTL